jgi:hypothetical protein
MKLQLEAKPFAIASPKNEAAASSLQRALLAEALRAQAWQRLPTPADNKNSFQNNSKRIQIAELKPPATDV